MLDLEYAEIDELLYPNIETVLEEIENALTKYGIMRLRYLHEHKREMYCELLFTGKLAEYCKTIDTADFEQSERDTGGMAKSSSYALGGYTGTYQTADTATDSS